MFDAGSRRVLVLAASAGWIDAVGFLTLSHIFTAHMSGNSAALGAFFGQGDWRHGLPHVFAIGVFLVGIFLGAIWCALPGRQTRRFAHVLWLEALLIAAFAWTLDRCQPLSSDDALFYAVAALPLLAMGLQNATLRRMGDMTIHTTYVTGVLHTLGEESAHAWLSLWAHRRRERFLKNWLRTLSSWSKEASVASSLKAGLLWTCYVSGALTGSYALHDAKVWCLCIPATALGLVGMLVWRSDNQS